MNRSMPSSTVIPVLGYPDVRAAVIWLERAFGFVERLRIGDHRSQLTYRDGDVVVTGVAPGGFSEHPDARRSIMVRVPDVDAHFARAGGAGAEVLSPPTDYAYGERQYTVLDLGGHAWTFSQTVADVDPGAWGGEVIE